MEKYDKILEVEKIEMGFLDKDTAIAWEVVRFPGETEEDDSWVCVEVWIDENSKIVVMEQSEEDAFSIEDLLTDKQRAHLNALVVKGLVNVYEKLLKEG